MQIPSFTLVLEYVRVWLLANFSVEVLPNYRIHTTLVLTLLSRIHPLLQSFEMNVTHGPGSVSRAHFRVIVGLIT